jgi:hypothetical protein
MPSQDEGDLSGQAVYEIWRAAVPDWVCNVPGGRWEDLPDSVRGGFDAVAAQQQPSDAAISAWIENNPREFATWVETQRRIGGVTPRCPACDRSGTTPAVHYRSLNGAPDTAACGLRRVPEGRLTADLDLVTCGNCTASVTWRADWSARQNKRSYHEEYGPGGSSDRAGWTRPNTATTAAQARASLEEAFHRELHIAAGLGLKGAGEDFIARAIRDSVRTLMGWADRVAALAAEERGAAG